MYFSLSLLSFITAAVLWNTALSSPQVPPEVIASQYGLTTSTSMPFPSQTASPTDTQALLVSEWSLGKGRVQDNPQNLAFVDDPYPNKPVPGSSSVPGPVLQVTYAEGSFSHETGGAQFYTLWNRTDGGNFNTMMVTYELAFDQNFDWVKGGKLPGLRGGLNSSGCSGGNKADGLDCFSSRLMWRKNGAGEVYAYIPTPNNFCSEKDITCNSDFGISIDRGAFGFTNGQWVRVTLLVRLNDPPNVANGYIGLYYNDIQAISQGNLQIRASDTVAANGLYFSTFFGGKFFLADKDLNDFIAPSQACIKPVEQTNAPKQREKQPGDASTEIMIDSSGTYYEVSPSSQASTSASRPNEPRQLAQAQISLNDCLACSGCITSAESVLITLQSHTEVLNFLKENGSLPDSGTDHGPTASSSSSSSSTASSSSSTYKIPVVSISPQSLASLATAISASRSKDVSCSPLEVFRGLRIFFTETLGFSQVYDTTFARHIALKEHIKEFEERRNRSRGGTESEEEAGLPMLASACPGWICYAEKAHKEMLPYISWTKSPQQVMGTIVKEYLGRKWGKRQVFVFLECLHPGLWLTLIDLNDNRPDEIYHVTVMPCYDKKLEASRQDFYNEIYATRDVDCVITTGELEVLLRECGWELSRVAEEGGPERQARDAGSEKLKDGSTIPEMMQHGGTSSGSYLHSIISHIRAESQVPLVLEIKAIRNADYEEFTVYEENGSGDETGKGKVVFKGAKCYGFRNLQNIVRKIGKEKGVRTGAGAAGRLGGRVGAGRRLKKGNTETEDKGYDYVEVMACPGGCVNGGGQMKPIINEEKEKDEMDTQMQGWKWGDRDWVRKVEETYWSIGKGNDDDDEELSKKVMEAGLSFRTSYRAVESEVIGLAVKW
ncbi:hypothetical protein CVT24_003951 [Panaeolus cyanescens]|uniref:Uncharacterized protein n=1 Tax=Panaeolus cyanescens TaxID=181874 RepID=A0A409Y6P6_9AGAR|nr:hypothetical protein CVT24_003951 [Panaeolus cyanescens]